MPLKAALIIISNTVRCILSKFANSRTLPAQQVQRAHIFLLCADGLGNLQISSKVGLGQDSVSKWRTRFFKALPILLEIEEKDPENLEKELTLLLIDYPRPGQPPTYTDEQIIRILEIACCNPADYGYEICSVYHNALSAHEAGIHTVSVDEMTGVQALEHKYPDKPVMPGSAAKIEFGYIRHGTTSLIGFFDVATGRMEAPYLNQTHTKEDFVRAVKALVETDPEARWIFVCDGLNTHKSESLVQYVAEQCGITEELRRKGKNGILKSLVSRAEFLHDENHRIQFVYTPKHCSWLNQIDIWFGIINRKLLKRKSYLSIQELEESIRRFINQFNVTASPFKWTYKGVPLTV